MQTQNACWSETCRTQRRGKRSKPPDLCHRDTTKKGREDRSQKRKPKKPNSTHTVPFHSCNEISRNTRRSNTSTIQLNPLLSKGNTSICRFFFLIGKIRRRPMMTPLSCRKSARQLLYGSGTKQTAKPPCGMVSKQEMPQNSAVKTPMQKGTMIINCCRDANHHSNAHSCRQKQAFVFRRLNTGPYFGIFSMKMYKKEGRYRL
ncbi:hypothetical protein GE09DRAFT_413647 [Coniochaeta sp. 2T2.1]|nr:hypothetical protein GE09DRAFT_413647 [Coniochaeta sp. 2T2.1]